MKTLLLLTIEVRAKVELKITLVEMIETVDPLSPRMIKLEENHTIATNLERLAASAEKVKTTPTLADPNFLAPSVAALIILLTTTQTF